MGGNTSTEKSIDIYQNNNTGMTSRNSGKKQKIVRKASDVDNPIHQEILDEYDILEVISINNHEMKDLDLIDNCIVNHFFMRCLETHARSEIIREMTLCKIRPEATLFKQGAVGIFFYIISQGEFDLFVNGKYVKTLSQGDSFGVQALLHGAPRSGTVISKTTCYVWCMERRNFKKIIDHINATNFEENKNFINSISLFKSIETNLKIMLASNLIKVYFSSGQYIIKETDIATCLYIIKEGEVDCQLNGKLIRTLHYGDYFGEKAVLLNGYRSMDVIARTDCVIYSISVETLKNLVGDTYIEVLSYNFLQMAFDVSKNFKKINSKLLKNAFPIFTVTNFNFGDIVIPAGHEIGSCIYIIIEGSLYNKTSNKKEFDRGEILFESALYTNDPLANKAQLTYDLYADPDCLIMSADLGQFFKCIGGTFKDILQKSLAMSSLAKVRVFKQLSQYKIEYLTSAITFEKFDHGAKIINQGDAGEKFYIIKYGKVEVIKDNKYIRTLNENESFGFRALFFREPRSATVQAVGKVELYVLSSSAFQTILEDKLVEYLRKKILLEDDSLTLSDLDFVKDLGCGTYGTVSLVLSNTTKYLYAIKAISRAQIDYERIHMNLEFEKSILLKVDHPFIIKFVKSMKDDDYLFFLMEYLRGKELWEVIRDIGLLNKYQTQFYSVSIMLALDYLHERKLMHRDIKPENVMVLDNGYIKLIDFGTGKEITDRTSSVIGTPHYMAPEAILGEGYTVSVDFWSLAICMYEFMCGVLPFGEGIDDPMEVKKLVLYSDLKFPSLMKDKEFKDLIKKMLNKSPVSRLCTLHHIKSHPWFRGFQFERLLNFELEPPYKSQIPDEGPFENLSPYLNHIPYIKQFQPKKVKVIDASVQEEYDNWFKNF